MAWLIYNNILVGGRTMSEGRAHCLSGATSQTADGETSTVTSTRRGSKEECYEHTQAKA